MPTPGYANGDEVAALAGSGIEALVATAAEGRRRRHGFRPAKGSAPEAKAEWLRAMAAKLASEEGGALCRLRQQTVEPVFGIIKAVLGVTGFSMGGLDKVTGEWDLAALAYNCKRLHKLKNCDMTMSLDRPFAPKVRSSPTRAGKPAQSRSPSRNPSPSELPQPSSRYFRARPL